MNTIGFFIGLVLAGFSIGCLVVAAKGGSIEGAIAAVVGIVMSLGLSAFALYCENDSVF